MKIMRVKQQDGTLVDVPFGKGADGKSAYQYAKDGGYTGTEAEFTQLLGNLNNGGGGGGGGSYTETDPTVPAWAKASTKPTYTKSEIGLGNVENKSSATIRGELTKANVTAALGYTPPTLEEIKAYVEQLILGGEW